MKSLLALAALALLASLSPSPLRSQEEEPEAPRRRGGGGIFGGGGGVVPAWLFLDTRDFNAALAGGAWPALSEKGLFLMGGHGYVYIVVVPNLRIGGMGAGGSLEATAVSDGTRSTTKLATSFGGVTVEYVVPFGRFHVAAGGLLGAGTMTATLTRMPDGDRAWPDIVDATTVSRQVLSATYLSWQPWLTCEFDVNPFLVVGVTGGWYGGTPTSWTYNDALTATGVPSFSFAGPFLRADVTAGLFIGE